MNTRFSDIDQRASSTDGGDSVGGASTADVLRLLSSGATGPILMALGEGPLRTKDLTERVAGYAPRTIYRYAGKLAALDVVEREEEPGVPSKVVHRLTEPCGSDLYDLVAGFAATSMAHLPDGRVGARAWASLGLLADLWGAGLVEELSCKPKSPTELARGPHGLSYHQVNRRAGLFKSAGLVREQAAGGRRRRYALTEEARRTMGLIVGVGRWRRRHVVAEHEEGMSAPEMATALRTSLPLVDLPEHAGRRFRLCVLGEGESDGDEGESIWVELEDGGRVHSCSAPTDYVDAWARGEVDAWIPAIVEGDAGRIPVVDDEQLVSDCLARLHDALWAPSPS